MELVKCSDYVLIEYENYSKIYKDEDEFLCKTVDYANFLKRPLELGMFIPCDLEGNALTYPVIKNNHIDECQCKYCIEEYSQYTIDDKQYQQAKERVLFEGFEVKEYNLSYQFWVGNKYISYDKPNGYFSDYDFIEQLTSLGLTLTQTAIKTIKI